MGIEPTYSAWKAEVLPLNYTRTNSANISHLQTYGGGGGLLQASCLPPFGPTLQIVLFKIAPSNFAKPLIGPNPPYLREYTRCKIS